MKRDEDVQILGSISEHLIQKLNEEHGNELLIEYIRADFLASAAIALSMLRHDAGLTQAQVAEQLHTRQSAIARLEADFDGAMSLRRYVDFALACGVIPHNFTFVPISVARSFTMAQPELPLTFENQQNWQNTNFLPKVDAESASTSRKLEVSSSIKTVQAVNSMLSVIESNLQVMQIPERAA